MKNRSWNLALAALSVAALPMASTRGLAATCGSLANLTLPNTTITFAQLVTTSPFTAADGQTFTVPEFCRVAGFSAPSSDAH